MFFAALFLIAKRWKHVLEISCKTMRISLMLPNSTIKNSSDGKFMYFYHELKKSVPGRL